MMTGPVDAATDVAKSVTSALQAAPVVLALVIFNLLFIGAIVYLSIHSDNQWAAETERWATIAQSCLPQR
jgi:hypothetical protein